jgi:hypothetical protein
LSHSINPQDGFELTVLLLSQPPKYWYSRCALPHQALVTSIL